MKTYKIYTAGKMGGLPVDEQMHWREELERLVRQKSDKSIVFVHPPAFFRYGEQFHKSENEARIWDMTQIRESDVVAVDLTTIADSIGTQQELGFIEAMNEFGYKHIYTIGIGVPNTDHPWVSLALTRREDNIEDAADYIVNYLLV